MTENIHAHEHPESDRVRPGGFTLWFTGLSGSGKSTIAHVIGPELDKRGLVVEYLDGDTVRTHLSKGLGFSKEDRDTHIKRVGWVASRLTRQGGAVIAATISPYEATRQEARANIDEVGTFVEIYVKTSVEECARRDVKGHNLDSGVGCCYRHLSLKRAGQRRNELIQVPDGLAELRNHS